MTAVSSILRSALEDRSKLNVLCFFLDGKFEEVLVNTGHNIYGAPDSFISQYGTGEGLKYLPSVVSEVPRDLNFDLVVYNHWESQSQKAMAASHVFHIPSLCVQHFGNSHPVPLQLPSEVVYVHESIRGTYEGAEGDIIRYGLEDPGDSEEERDIDLLIHGNFIPRDFHILDFIKGLRFKTEVWGDNPGVSEAISQEDLIKKMQKTKIFLNLSTHLGIPHSAVQAMMCGCAVVSNTNEITPKLFTEDFSSLVNEVSEFAPTINKMLDGDWKTMGHKAREKALVDFDMKRNTAIWKEKLEKKANEVYVR